MPIPKQPKPTTRADESIVHIHDKDPDRPFLSDIVEDGEYHCTNTPNGCNFDGINTDLDARLHGVGGPRVGGVFSDMVGYFLPYDRKKWDGNRSGE